MSMVFIKFLTKNTRKDPLNASSTHPETLSSKLLYKPFLLDETTRIDKKKLKKTSVGQSNICQVIAELPCGCKVLEGDAELFLGKSKGCCPGRVVRKTVDDKSYTKLQALYCLTLSCGCHNLYTVTLESSKQKAEKESLSVPLRTCRYVHDLSQKKLKMTALDWSYFEG